MRKIYRRECGEKQSDEQTKLKAGSLFVPDFSCMSVLFPLRPLLVRTMSRLCGDMI
jgi:hypothetical protein